MPQVDISKSDNIPVYGESEYKNVTTFREKLSELIQPHQFGRVINIDDDRFVWQYMPSVNETYEYVEGPHRHTNRGDVEVWELEPGESDVLLGENAYVMIEALYKKIKAKQVISSKPEMKPGQARAFGFYDDISQVALIKKIFLGVVKPEFAGIDTTASMARKLVDEPDRRESTKTKQAA